MVVGYGRILGKGADNFFGHVVYVAGEGNHIRFLHDPWSGPISLRDLYSELFACAVAQEAWISDLVFTTPNGGGRSGNLIFRHDFHD